MQRGRILAAAVAASVCAGALATGAIGSAAASPTHLSAKAVAPVAVRYSLSTIRRAGRSASARRLMLARPGASGLALATGQATPSTATVNDVAGDNAPGRDPHGDLRVAAVGFGKYIAVGAATNTFDDPSSSVNWRGYALGYSGFTAPGTGLVWGLDVNGDGNVDDLVDMLSDGFEVIAGVTDATGNVFLCGATPSLDPSVNGYFAAFSPACVGSPKKVRAQAFLLYETSTKVSNDITAWTGPVAPPKPPPPPRPAAARSGYWMLGSDAHVYPFGGAVGFDVWGFDVTAIAPRKDGKGYWLVGRAGHVAPFGSARFFGNASSLAAGEFVSTISATASENGYWLFTNRGRALPFGDARSFGDMSGAHLNGPIVASVATPTGHGYYMVGSDGGIFSFGDARFHGSTGGMPLNKPVVGIAPTPDGRGYWLVASDGGVFAFGAPFRGSMGGTRLNQAVDGLVAYGNGYLMVASDGGVFDFSNKAFAGSLADHPPPAPIIAIAAFSS